MTRARRRHQSGQASVVLVGALLICLAFTGLAVDGARLFTARRDLQNVADSAALAGASAIDESHFRDTAGRKVRLDPGSAQLAVDRVLQASGLPVTTAVDVEVEPDRVVVHISRPVEMTFLRIAGMREEDIGATATGESADGLSVATLRAGRRRHERATLPTEIAKRPQFAR